MLRIESIFSTSPLFPNLRQGGVPLRKNRSSNTNLIFRGCVLGLWFILKLNNYGDV